MADIHMALSAASVQLRISGVLVTCVGCGGCFLAAGHAVVGQGAGHLVRQGQALLRGRLAGRGGAGSCGARGSPAKTGGPAF